VTFPCQPTLGVLVPAVVAIGAGTMGACLDLPAVPGSARKMCSRAAPLSAHVSGPTATLPPAVLKATAVSPRAPTRGQIMRVAGGMADLRARLQGSGEFASHS
jgi:hypothetical protein